MIKYVCDWCNEVGLLPDQGIVIVRRSGNKYVPDVRKDLCDACQNEFLKSLTDTQTRIWAAKNGQQ
jgi:hypothetical protein